MKSAFLFWFLLTFSGPLWLIISGQIDLKSHYSTANRDSAHLAPVPAVEKGAVIQAYAARAFNWRGAFASHCWIAVKPANSAHYTVYQVMGWQTYHGLPALVIQQDIPDRNWFNEVPKLILDIRGEKAERLIPKVKNAVTSYHYSNPYVLWPGPNSNSFPAYVGRQVPELGLVMPSDAVGKDFLGKDSFFTKTPSGTGYQISLWGLLGLSVAKKEGIEVNILGLVYGVRFSPFKILLPGLG